MTQKKINKQIRRNAIETIEFIRNILELDPGDGVLIHSCNHAITLLDAIKL